MVFWDKLIILALIILVVIDLLAIVIIVKLPAIKNLGIIILVGSIFGQMVLIYGSWIEPHWIATPSESLVLTDEPTQELKVILIADYHLGPYKQADFVERTVQMINSQEPDLVLIAGDFIYAHADYVDDFASLATLESKYGVYAVLGNHDYGISRSNSSDNQLPGAIRKSEYVLQKLTEFGVEVLSNENKRIELDGKEIVIVGMEDLWGGTDDLEKSFTGVTEEDTVILLEHNPDIVLDPRSSMADLIVSGHTHGGQIRLPILGAVGIIPTQLGQDYDYGLFDLDSGNKLYITKGIGEMGPRARLFCRPEIVTLNISF